MTKSQTGNIPNADRLAAVLSEVCDIPQINPRVVKSIVNLVKNLHGNEGALWKRALAEFNNRNSWNDRIIPDSPLPTNHDSMCRKVVYDITVGEHWYWDSSRVELRFCDEEIKKVLFLLGYPENSKTRLQRLHTFLQEYCGSRIALNHTVAEHLNSYDHLTPRKWKCHHKKVLFLGTIYADKEGELYAPVLEWVHSIMLSDRRDERHDHHHCYLQRLADVPKDKENRYYVALYRPQHSIPTETVE